MKIDRLDLLCSSGDVNPLFQSPLGIEVDGHRYVVATNNSALIAIQTEAFELTALDTRFIPSRIAEWIRLLRANGKPIGLSSLREWAGSKSEAENCQKCGGTQEITCRDCNGSRRVDCECLHCGDYHDADCECIDGKEPCPECTSGGYIPIKPGKIDGYVFNSEIVSRALAIIESDTSFFWLEGREDHGILYLGDKDWIIVIMGLRHKDGLEKQSVPTWSSEEAMREVASS